MKGVESVPEKKNRIRVALFAYAYEIMGESLVTDCEYDRLSRQINPDATTGDDEMDRFFATEYSPDTGMWIYHHPKIDGIMRIYTSITGKPATPIDREGEGSPNQLTNTPPFKTHFEGMLYLAMLGFRIVPRPMHHRR